ncbi:MAG: TetR/AcrR family transcriptional regulator [Myxococcales bacterium]|jgi:AcrR family transcriptional regulator
MEKALPAVQADWRERKFERNRTDILEAAARAFANKGLSGATMQDIAAEAGYTVPTLYSYFKSRDDIVQGLMLMMHRELISTFEEPPASGLSFAQNLELLMRRALELADRRRATLLMMLGLERHPVSRDEKGCTAFDQLQRTVERWIEQASGGQLGGRTTEEATLCMLGIWHSYFASWLLRGCEARLADSTTTVVDLILHGICGRGVER